MRTLETTGKTVDEAISFAAAQLGVHSDRLDIEVLEQPVKGLFGLIGGKNAKVRASVKMTMGDKAQEFVSKLLNYMDIQADIEIFEEEAFISVVLKGPEMGLLIGHRGETLDSIQYLTGLAINRGNETYKRVLVDTQEYRIKREQTLKNLADRLARNVQKAQKEFVLEPMNPYERRIIHSTLQHHPYVKTYSRGEEPYRRVVVTLRENKNNKPRIEPNEVKRS